MMYITNPMATIKELLQKLDNKTMVEIKKNHKKYSKRRQKKKIKNT